MYIADLHIHSRFSRATSKDGNPVSLDQWARRKGIGLVGTGDFTHPAWREELREQLVPAEQGLYTLREDLRRSGDGACDAARPRFIVTGEISSIYKKNGRVRKVHNLILLKSLEAADALAHRLEQVGNLHSDGRPILGLDCRDLLEITLETCPDAIFIPAHIWTPHFSLFGAFSGFDTIEECFEDLTPHIHALETGLSSDPPMNWRLSALDPYLLVSNSDAHSPNKLGREANLLDTALTYDAVKRALDGAGGFAGTIEFFPEEGKYHYDGHRNCGLCLSPSETIAAGGICPVCGKKLTIGVLHRVEELADRPEGTVRPNAMPFERLAPLPEVIAASTGYTSASGRVQRQYEAMLHALGSEFFILREAPLDAIGRLAGPYVKEGIRRLRAGRVTLSPGFDGEFGKLQLLNQQEIDSISGQMTFFNSSAIIRPKTAPRRRQHNATAASKATASKSAGLHTGLNPEQLAAVRTEANAVAVIAGPGTGKTKTLVARIAHLVAEKKTPPAAITAVTFTNQAAAELRERLEKEVGRTAARTMTIGTFHAICLRRLEAAGKSIRLLDESQALCLAADILRACSCKCGPRRLLETVSCHKTGRAVERNEALEEACRQYTARLEVQGLSDFDDLLLQGLALSAPAKGGALLVDEFQDIDSLQYRLVRAWGTGGSVFVIGDPDQSIYGFRGADATCFDRFRADFPNVETIHLTRNYRSTPQILRCAAGVIGHGGLRPQREDGPAVRLLTAKDPFAEAVFVTKEIARMVGGIDMLGAHSQAALHGEEARGFADIAVLYRTHRQAQTLEACLKQEGIPYLVAGRDDFLTDPAVQTALGFFRALAAGKPLPDAPEGVGPMDWQQLGSAYASLLDTEKPRPLLERFSAETGLVGDAFQKLCQTAALHHRMVSLLDTLALGVESDVRRGGGQYTPDAVSLMTLHGAKGLEFSVVFLCGLCQGVLPLEQPGRISEPAEERRLFYVGITRAKKELVLLTGPSPSPLIADLPHAELITGLTHQPHPRAAEQLSLF